MTRAVHALLVAGTEGFSRRHEVDLLALHTEVRSAVGAACERSGLGRDWQTTTVRPSTGDGVLAVLPLTAIEALVDPFPRHLQAALAEARPRLRARGQRLRLRVAVHFGPVDPAAPATASRSAAIAEASRLAACPPVRAALRDSDPDVTLAAAIISAETFEAYVSGGYTGLRPSQFTPVRVPATPFDRLAYLHVPEPGGSAPQALGHEVGGAPWQTRS